MELQSNKVLLLVGISGALITSMLWASTLLPSQAATIAFSQSNFHTPLKIDNKYLPLEPGTTKIYNGTSGGDPTRDLFVITNETKEIAGITTRVVHDDGYVKADHEETTNDWFAQDDSGNVWYMGEFTTDLSNKGSHQGSWEAGVKGAKAGVVMEAEPKVGDTYNQEFAKGVAEDKGTILSSNEKLCVPYGCFSSVLKTKDFSPLEPDIVENKYYAQNIGEIKAISVKGESDAETLKQINGTGNNVSSLLPINQTR